MWPGVLCQWWRVSRGLPIYRHIFIFTDTGNLRPNAMACGSNLKISCFIYYIQQGSDLVVPDPLPIRQILTKSS